ncbi:hypothetical protein H0H92_012291 [Tricholoma furcatifolium]|nr:hypothetical protein H0H92_012291 [Tricholoma furcatifolium]
MPTHVHYDVLPSYDFDVCTPSPSYSQSASSTEHVFFDEHAWASSLIIETKHMKINITCPTWGVRTPSYGFGGKIEGTVLFSGDQDCVERVAVTLSGSLTASLAYDGNPGDPLATIVSDTIELYSSAKNDIWAWDQERPFLIPIPTTFEVHGRSSPTPPSFFAFYQKLACEVSYTLEFHMIRYGWSRKHEIQTIPIFYLPKSTPDDPPLASIPRFIRGLENSASSLGIFERVRSLPIIPIHPSSHKIKFNLEPFKNSVILSLPSPQCFTSGELIPFTLSLVFPKDPVLASLMVPAIHLLRRVNLRGIGGGALVQRDTPLSSADFQTSKEFTEGVKLLRGDIRAGTAGGEASWQIEDIIQVQYVLRVVVRPPNGLRDHIPCFSHEEIVDLTTDHWGTLVREIASVGARGWKDCQKSLYVVDDAPLTTSASMFAAATSFFGRTAISQSYNFGPSGGSRPSTPGQPSTSLNSSGPLLPSISVGLWKVQPATHKVTNKRVSVWSFDKRGPDMERLGVPAKERTLEVMKAEASALGRLRHPSILGSLRLALAL